MAEIAGTPALMPTEQPLAIPDEGIVRELYALHLGQLVMSRRRVRQTCSGGNVTALLRDRIKTRPWPRGRVLSGDGGCRLRRYPDTTVGIDIAYISAAVAAGLPDEAFLIDGATILTPPAVFNVTRSLDGGPHLPGFGADVAEVFADRSSVPPGQCGLAGLPTAERSRWVTYSYAWSTSVGQLA